MKVTTEKVNKVKAFEPFKLIIEFDDIDDARNLIKEIDFVPLENKIEMLILIYEELSAELSKQGFH